MELRPTALDGVVEAVPKRHGDHRGWFSETWNEAAWVTAGYALNWVQDNESLSAQVGTVRGIHFQRAPFAQDKLVRVISGRILDVAVDLRKSSPTFGAHVSIELTAAEGNQLLVPRGFGHGFATLEPDCRVAYKVTAPYNADCDAGISWSDPGLAIDWGISAAEAAVSDKDANAPLMGDALDLLFD